MSLPMSGTAWAALKARADLPAGSPNLSNQDDPNDVTALAKALVYARTGIVQYRTDTITMLKAAVGTEYPGDALGIARGVTPLVLAADLVGWRDPAWMGWLSRLRTWANPDRGYTLVSMHEKRPNNWGTHSGAGRIAADLYLGDMTDLARAAKVFKGYLGDRDSRPRPQLAYLHLEAPPRRIVEQLAINARLRRPRPRSPGAVCPWCGLRAAPR